MGDLILQQNEHSVTLIMKCNVLTRVELENAMEHSDSEIKTNNIFGE